MVLEKRATLMPLLFYGYLMLLLILVAVLVAVVVRRVQAARRPQLIEASSEAGEVPPCLLEWHKLCEDLRLSYVVSDELAGQLRAGTRVSGSMAVRLTSSDENDHFENLIGPDNKIVDGYTVQGHTVSTPSGGQISVDFYEAGVSVKNTKVRRELFKGVWLQS